MLSSSLFDIILRDELLFGFDFNDDFDFGEASFGEEEYRGFWPISLSEPFSEQDTELPERSFFCRGSDMALEVELSTELFVLLLLLRWVSGTLNLLTSDSDYNAPDSDSSPHSLSNF